MAKQIKKYSKIALIIALSVTMSVLFLRTPQVQAGTLTGREVRLTDSRISDVAFYGASTTADYDFQATGTASNIECIKVWFCNSAVSPSYDGTGCTADGPPGINFGDVDLGNAAAWNNLTYGNWSIIASSTNYITASTSAAEQLGNGGSWVFGNIYNPSVTSTYYTWIYTFKDTTTDCLNPSSGDVLDSGLAAFAVFQGVTVTATVVEDLSVTITASSCDGYLEDSIQSIGSATTSIGYGNIVAENFYDSCQRIDIGTNASNGYIARIYKTQQLTSGGDIIADGVCDDSPACTISADEDWQDDENNGFGYCMQDKTLNGAEVADSDWATVYCGPSASQQFKLISNSTSTAEAIMQSNSATSTNVAWIAYRLSVDSGQPAGTYSTEIIYVVTPKF